MFSNIDLPVYELERLTVEAAQAGMLSIGRGASLEIVRFPESICWELLDYAKRQKIQGGSIFRTRDGVSMSRSNVTINIWQLCATANVLDENGNPRCPRKLYQSTRVALSAASFCSDGPTQKQLLDDEQLAGDWENSW